MKQYVFIVHVYSPYIYKHSHTELKKQLFLSYFFNYFSTRLSTALRVLFPRPLSQPQIKRQLRKVPDPVMALSAHSNTVPLTDRRTALRTTHKFMDVPRRTTHIRNQAVMFSEHRARNTIRVFVEHHRNKDAPFHIGDFSFGGLLFDWFCGPFQRRPFKRFAGLQLATVPKVDVVVLDPQNFPALQTIFSPRVYFTELLWVFTYSSASFNFFVSRNTKELCHRNP